MVLALLVPVVLGQLVGPLDVPLLCGFVATAQQQNDSRAVVQVVDPVARTEPQPKLPDALAKRLGIPWIARSKPA
jgi:hypothetical protein